MKVIIIGAGRGRRLMPTTADTPKCYAEVAGRRLLDWGLAAFEKAGLRDFCFVGGYQIEKVKRDYPKLTFRHNATWEHNNILLSLMHAEDLMDEGFVCCYSDTLFTSDVVNRVLQQPADISLSVDTRWLERYEHRTQHPPTDAEKVTVANGWVTRVPSRPSTPTANTPGWRSSPRPGPRNCEPISKRPAANSPANRSGKPPCSKKLT
jgi:choline kinase